MFSKLSTNKPLIKESKVVELQKTNLVKSTTTNTTKVGNTILSIEGRDYTLDILYPITVENFMNELKENGNIDYTYKTYTGMGKLIDSINGKKNEGGEYWTYYVNGEEAIVGISNYLLNPGDVVSWKYGKEL